MQLSRLLFRAWSYFRTGYGTYITFIIGGAQFLVSVYYLAIKSIPALQLLFESFTTFSIFVILVGTPLSILVGWLHIKRTHAWGADMDISAEANPYNYRLPPGYWKEALAPLYLELLVLTSRLAEKEGLLEGEEKALVAELRQKLQTLREGGFVGKPYPRA